MIRRPFLIFVTVITVLVTSLILFFQSPEFAHVVKKICARYLPKDLGIDADFTELNVKFFPPGISIIHPEFQVRSHNILNLPSGSSVRADQIDLTFLPFQMLTGDIRVHEARIVHGDVDLTVEMNKKEKKEALSKKLDLHWDELLHIHAEAIAAENTHVKLHMTGLKPGEKRNLEFFASSVRLAQWSGSGGLGYEIAMKLSQIQGDLAAGFLNTTLDSVELKAHVNAVGVGLDSLSVVSKGLAANAQGSIHGNILQGMSLPAEGKVQIKGDASSLLDKLPKDKNGKPLVDFAGRVQFDGKVRCDLLKAFETLRADGNLDIEGAKFNAWHADHVHAEGAWAAQENNGEVLIRKALITENERPSVGGFQSGSGGTIEIGTLRIPLKSDIPITASLKFEHAHVHWLGAIALKSVYPLDFRVSGPVQLTFSPAMSKSLPWGLQAQVDLSVDDFQLDNQRWQEAKPMHRVFKVKHFDLKGPITVDPRALHAEGVSLSINHSLLKTSGKIDFKTGYDLSWKGPIDLADLGEIAENEVRGVGMLAGHAHGPSSGVLIDVDADLKNLFYLKMNLGDVHGRISWDDDPDHLIFSNIHFNQRQTQYVANGLLDLGKTDTADLHIAVTRGNISDLIYIFNHQTEDLGWFPHTLNGPLSGSVLVSGGLRMDKLKVLAKFTGNEWEFAGERFKQVSIVGGYDGGKYYLQDFHVTKRAGRFNGHISFDQENHFDWDFHTQDFNVSDLDHIARLDVPIRGRLDVSSVGHGLSSELVSTTQWTVSEVAVRGIAMPSSLLSLNSSGGMADLRGTGLGGQATVEGHYEFRPHKPGYLKANLNHLDFSPLVLLLNPSLIKDLALTGFLSGTANLNFREGELDLSSGIIELREYMLAKTGSKFILAHPVSIQPKEGDFDVTNLTVRGNSGESVFNMKSRKSAISGNLKGHLDLSLLEFLTSSVQRSAGIASLDFSLAGTLKAPSVFGKATLEGGSIQVPGVESPFENLAGSVQLHQNELSVQNITADLAGGRVAADGMIDLYATRYPELALRAQIVESKIKVYPFQYAKIHGNISLKGSDIPYLIDGKVVVDSALSTQNVLSQKQNASVKAVQYTPPPNKNSDNGYPKFKLNIECLAESGVMIKDDLFEAEAKANVTVVNTLELPRIVGTAEFIQGKILFKDKTFVIQSGSANFDNPTVIDPSFNLTGTTEVNGTKIRLYASGRPSKFKIDLSSTPVLPESEILSLLALGVTSSDTNRLSGSDRSVFEQGEAASLLLQSLDFNRDIENKTGIKIQLDEAVNNLQGSSIFKPQNTLPDSAAPRIVIKRKIGPNLEVSYGSTVGVGSNNERQVNTEMHVTPGLSVIGVWDNYDTADFTNQTSYGLDFKLQKRFK